MNISRKSWINKCGVNPHAIILGDNSVVLKDLHHIYDGKIDLVYIDPPYNRGENYRYYSDFKVHELWVEQIQQIISELKELLSDDGSIWISIDDREMAYLKIVCDEIFGRNNCIATIIWQKRNTRENRKIFSNNHEYILVYSKYPDRFKKKRHLLPATDEIKKRYKNPDNDPRGPWQSISLNVQAGHAVNSQFYTITSPAGISFNPPKGRCWIYNADRMNEEIEKNNIWFGKDGTAVPRKKKFLADSNVGVVPETLWLSDFAGTTKNAKDDLVKLNIYDSDIFDTPKPEKLIYQILSIATDENDIVLDCYLGSGTTAAVAHKMQRNYIGIDNSPETINYVEKRMNKVIEGEAGGISKNVGWHGGGNYEVIKW